jgi:CRISPR-associated protein Csd2
MFDHDHSAARGMMATRRLIAFKHASALGCARASDLFARAAAATMAETPRSYGDYVVTVDTADLPEGIKVLELV